MGGQGVYSALGNQFSQPTVANVSDITKPYLIIPSCMQVLLRVQQLVPLPSKQSSMRRPKAATLITGNIWMIFTFEKRTCNERGNLQSGLDEFLDWSLRSLLKLNPDKCETTNIHFMRNQPRVSLHIRISKLVTFCVHNDKVLGTYTQEDLKWDTQVNRNLKNCQ